MEQTDRERYRERERKCVFTHERRADQGTNGSVVSLRFHVAELGQSKVHVTHMVRERVGSAGYLLQARDEVVAHLVQQIGGERGVKSQ